MARFNRIEVVVKMEETGIVPVFYHKDIEFCKEILTACYRGGVRVFEFTNRGDFAHEIFGELNRWASVNTPEMILGIGSIVEQATAALYIQLGANFVVSPIVNPEMAKICNRRKVAWMPGCGSVSEISYAEELGAEVVKVFPAEQVGGPAFVKGVKGPMPWSRIMPTGGVDDSKENLTAWFNSGVSCVGMGSVLFKQVLQDGNMEDFSTKVSKVVSNILALKMGKHL